MSVSVSMNNGSLFGRVAWQRIIAGQLSVSLGGCCTSTAYRLTADTERVRYAIDVVEPGSDQSHLQYGAVVESFAAQAFVVLRANPRRVFCEFHDVIQHRTLRDVPSLGCTGVGYSIG